MKMKIFFSLIAFSNLFCAEEDAITISQEKNPILCQFIKIEEFNCANLSNQIIMLHTFYRQTHFFGSIEFRRKKAREIYYLIESLARITYDEQDIARLQVIRKSIDNFYPGLIKVSLNVKDEDYFKP